MDASSKSLYNISAYGNGADFLGPGRFADYDGFMVFDEEEKIELIKQTDCLFKCGPSV